MKQKNETDARNLEQEELEKVNGGKGSKNLLPFIGTDF